MFFLCVVIGICLILGIAAINDIVFFVQRRGLRDDSERYRQFINYRD